MSIDVWELISYLAWIGWATAMSSFIVGIALRSRGDERGSSLVVYSFLAMLVLAFGYGLVTSIYGTNINVPYSWMLYAISATMMILSAIYLALGRVEEGAWQFVGALLVIGVAIFAFTLTSGGGISAAGTLTVSLYPSSTMIKNGEALTLGVVVAGTDNAVGLSIDWGDGTQTNAVIEPGKLHRFNHTYLIPSNEPAKSFSVRVNATDSMNVNVFGRNVVAVVVQNQDYCPLGWPWNAFCGLYRLASAVLPAIDLQKLTECPTFPTNEGDPIYGVYRLVLSVSMAGFGLFLAFGLVWSVVSGESAKALVDVVKDAVVVLALALLAPWIYNATASTLNMVTYQLIGSIDVGWAFAWISLQVALAAVVGYFIPFIANYGAFLAITLFLASVFVYVRYVLILAMVAASPLLAVAYLHPGLRGMVKHVVSLQAGLMLAGPLAAVFLVILNKVIPGQDVVFGLLFPLVVGILPNVLGMFGAGIAQSVAGAVVGGVRQLATAVRPVAGTRAAVAVPASQHASRAAIYKPIITPERIRTAREVSRIKAEELGLMRAAATYTAMTEAERASRTAEEVMRMKAYARAYSRDLAEPAAEYEHAKALEEMRDLEREASKSSEVLQRAEAYKSLKPKWEGFKAAAKTLMTHAGRQALVNVKGLAKETAMATAEQLGISVGERVRDPSVIKEKVRKRF